jgi:pyruvate/2-oxoglutarate dehydrogenase complex dihydrolipoamide dehydrogenase (E3) component
VIGGGPAGLNAAGIAGRRGHRVELFEKNPFLGGRLFFGSIPNYKREIQNLIRFLKHQAEKYGVNCHLNCMATVNTIKEINPNVVIIATGSIPLSPPFEVDSSNLLVPLEAVLNGGSPILKKTVIIGGGATGCELALHLAEGGSHVTLIEMLSKLGRDIEAMTRKILIHKLNELKVTILTETKVSRLEENGVRVVDRNNKERFLETESVVQAIGFRKDSRLYDQIKSLGYEVHQIGDCVEPRNAKSAIYEGAALGRLI